jgi:hypothetical protein
MSCGTFFTRFVDETTFFLKYSETFCMLAGEVGDAVDPE